MRRKKTLNPRVKMNPMGKSKGHIPIRTCIVCRAKRSKKELIRLTIDARGLIVRDDHMKIQSRGAYVCPNKSCWDKLAMGSTRFNKAFRKKGPMVFHPEFPDRSSGVEIYRFFGGLNG